MCDDLFVGGLLRSSTLTIFRGMLMTRDEFISELELVFNVATGSLNLETELTSLKAWDSLGVLSIISLMKQVGAAVKADQFQDVKTIGDLVNLVGGKVNGAPV